MIRLSGVAIKKFMFKVDQRRQRGWGFDGYNFVKDVQVGILHQLFGVEPSQLI